MNDKELGRRIKDERERRNLSQQKLAELAGISHRQSIGKIEDGERKLQATELYGISKALGVSPEVLLTNSTSPTMPQYLWRKVHSDVKAEWEGRFSGHIANFNFVENVLLLTDVQSLELPHKVIDVMALQYNDVYSLAEQIREQLALGAFPSRNLEIALEEKYGVRIFYVDLHDQGSAATSRTMAPTIFLNRHEAPWRRTFSLAHELFHLITWTDDIAIRAEKDSDFHEKNEKLAEAFAAGLLMPSEVLTSELKKTLKDGHLTYTDLIALSRTFGVSTAALLYRLANLRFISFDLAKKIMNDHSFKEIDKQDQNERWHTPASLSEKFIKLAYQAYQASKLSKARLAEMLEIPLIDVENLLADRGLVEVDDNEIPLSIS